MYLYVRCKVIFALFTPILYSYIFVSINIDALLTMHCQAECNEWGDCLEILGEDNRLDTPDVKVRYICTYYNTVYYINIAYNLQMKSALFYLRGRAFEALENRQKAALWYQKAIVADVHCFEVNIKSLLLIRVNQIRILTLY